MKSLIDGRPAKPMLRVLAFVVLTASFACPSLARALDCATPEQRGDRLSELIAMADGLRSSIQHVPPSEAKFIRREVDAAIISPKVDAATAAEDQKAAGAEFIPENIKRGLERFSVIQNNRYFSALQVHDTLDNVIKELRLAEGKGVKQQALNVINALEWYVHVTANLDAYRTDGKRAQDDGIAAARTMQLHSEIPELIGDFAKCLVKQLPAN